MEATLIRLENGFEEALRAFLEAEGSEREGGFYCRFLEAFEALKAFETAAEPVRSEPDVLYKGNDLFRGHLARF